MTDRPILFSAPMVRAILAGRKTQTRRTLKFQPAPSISIVRKTVRPFDAEPYHSFERSSMYGNYAGELDIKVKCGDRLWVRETVMGEELPDGCDGVRYLADDAFVPIADTAGSVENWLDLHWYGRQGGNPELRGRSVPSIHMLKWASRLTLLVTDVRVERLQDISEADAIAEGIEVYDGIDPDCSGYVNYRNNSEDGYWIPAKASYAGLWNSINGPGSWDANPWVVAYTFRPILGNISQVASFAATEGSDNG